MVSKKLLSNNNGATLIYILAAFMIISFIGVTMIKQSHHEMKSSSDFSSMTTAEDAARSGLEATKTFFEKHTNPNGTDANNVSGPVVILNAYVQDASHNPRWILGNATTTIAINEHLSYKTELINFAYDVVNHTNDFKITVKSYGYGKDGSSKTIISVIDLTGIEWGSSSSVKPMNALDLGQGAGEIVAPLTIGTLADGGDIYVRNPQSYFVGAGSPKHSFYGLFRTVEPDNVADEMEIKNAIFYNKAYFRVRIKNDGDANEYRDNVGFEKGIADNDMSTLKSGAKIFTNGSIEAASGGITVESGAEVIRWTNATPCQLKGTGSGNVITESDSIENMQTRMGITKDDPPEITFDLSVIPPSLIHDYATVMGSGEPDADDFEDAYTNNARWNDFLVIKGRNSSWNVIGKDGTFTKKVIWILENESPLYQSDGMFEIGADGVFIFYLNNTTFGQLNNANFKFPNYFRGFVYTEGNLSTEYHVIASRNTVIDGAMIFKDAIFRLEVGVGPMTVKYNESLLNQLSVLGLFTDDDPQPTDVLVPVSPIRCTQLGAHF